MCDAQVPTARSPHADVEQQQRHEVALRGLEKKWWLAEEIGTTTKWVHLTKVEKKKKRSDAIKKVSVEPNDEYKNMVKGKLQYSANQHEELLDHLTGAEHMSPGTMHP